MRKECMAFSTFSTMT
ncbi:rCG56389 [Rattus norvegicus]|uniref:RCG56389 n=1 Tax=Rattus norvegicus TaxID=10116 RepID=A6IAA5_RAT|nr:rCG56389 [Rattus norvegicus]